MPLKSSEIVISIITVSDFYKPGSCQKLFALSSTQFYPPGLIKLKKAIIARRMLNTYLSQIIHLLLISLGLINIIPLEY